MGFMTEPHDIQRVNAVAKIVESLKSAYPDVKKLHVDIQFEFVQTEFWGDESGLCPVVKIDVER
jgi:hypothetical protein